MFDLIMSPSNILVGNNFVNKVLKPYLRRLRLIMLQSYEAPMQFTDSVRVKSLITRWRTACCAGLHDYFVDFWSHTGAV